ncbi:MAG TPA: DUF3382 domain-containing protein, partial [Kiloniellales bacterium]
MAVSAAEGIVIRPLNLVAMVREASITALVVFALAISLVGFQTLDVTGGVGIRTRFADVAVAMAIAFVGRIGLILLREHRPRPVLIAASILAVVMLILLLSETFFGADTGGALKRFIPFNDPVVLWGVLVVTLVLAVRAGYALRHMSSSLTVEQREQRMDQISAGVQRGARLLGPLFLVFAVALPFMPFADRRLLDIGILVLTYIMLGWGLNIVVGLAGLLDLGYVAFYAVGAYSFGLLATKLDVSFWLALPFAGLMAGTAGG